MSTVTKDKITVYLTPDTKTKLKVKMASSGQTITNYVEQLIVGALNNND